MLNSLRFISKTRNESATEVLIVVIVRSLSSGTPSAARWPAAHAASLAIMAIQIVATTVLFIIERSFVIVISAARWSSAISATIEVRLIIACIDTTH